MVIAVSCYSAHYRYFPAENFPEKGGVSRVRVTGNTGKAGRVRSVSRVRSSQPAQIRVKDLCLLCTVVLCDLRAVQWFVGSVLSIKQSEGFRCC